MSDPTLDPNLTPDPNSREPLLTVAAIITGGTALLAAGAAFGLPITDTQQAAILAVLAIAAPLIVGWIGRSKVYAPATVARLLDETGD